MLSVNKNLVCNNYDNDGDADDDDDEPSNIILTHIQTDISLYTSRG